MGKSWDVLNGPSNGSKSIPPKDLPNSLHEYTFIVERKWLRQNIREF